ncbi:MAG: hypothetical protein AAF547_15015 [Actinomycetota bacterium]
MNQNDDELDRRLQQVGRYLDERSIAYVAPEGRRPSQTLVPMLAAAAAVVLIGGGVLFLALGRDGDSQVEAIGDPADTTGTTTTVDTTVPDGGPADADDGPGEGTDGAIGTIGDTAWCGAEVAIQSRITFQPGRFDGEAAGTLTAGSAHVYVAEAATGQLATISVEGAGGPALRVQGPGGAFRAADVSDTAFVTDAGDLRICVLAAADTDYRLVVDLRPADQGSTDTTAPAAPGDDPAAGVCNWSEEFDAGAISFAAGTSSATVSGGVVRATANRHTIDAGAGQRLLATMTSAEDNGAFVLIGPNGDPVPFPGREARPTTAVDVDLVESGIHTFCVTGVRGNVSYDLTVAIDPPELLDRPDVSSAEGCGADPVIATMLDPARRGGGFSFIDEFERGRTVVHPVRLSAGERLVARVIEFGDALALTTGRPGAPVTALDPTETGVVTVELVAETDGVHLLCLQEDPEASVDPAVEAFDYVLDVTID